VDGNLGYRECRYWASGVGDEERHFSSCYSHLVGHDNNMAWALLSYFHRSSKFLQARSVGQPLLAVPVLSNKVTWAQIVSNAAKKFGHCRKKAAVVVPNHITEEWWLETFPPRQKSDLGIRRTRVRDLVDYVTCSRKESLLQNTLCRLRDFDYICALNICWSGVLLDEGRWTQQMSRTGCFDDGVEHFVKVCKWLSDCIKRGPVDMENWLPYVECHSLTGYRNLPFPGFDYEKEAKDLAHGGLKHKYPPGYSFKQLVDEALDCPPVVTDFISFEDFVASREWVTSGSSSIGKMEVEMDGKVHKFKARKNTLVDLYTDDELVDRCKRYVGQRNTTLVKSELGKVRLAVAGDIETYLLMAWVVKLTGKAYLSWDGSTGEESVSQLCSRLDAMLKKSSDGFSLPFDFQKFDHQPTTDELKEIFRWLLDRARLSVPPTYYSYFDTVAGKLLHSFDTASLFWKDPTTGKCGVERVLGGLMSGLRLTSIIGDAWNLVMTYAVGKLLEGVGVDTAKLEKYVRGDDSAVFGDSFQALRLFAEGYRKMGVLGGEGKFSVLQGQTEFLRVWFDKHCLGYPARIIPGLVQRKPWTSTPWKEDGVIMALKEVCSALDRRGVDGVLLFKSLGRTWCRILRLPFKILGVPRFLGGIGLLPWDGKTRCAPAFPKVVDEEVARVRIRTKTRAQVWKNRADEIGVILSEGEADQLAQAESLCTLRSDDIVQLGSYLRDKWRDKLRLERPKIVEYSDRFAPLGGQEIYPGTELESLAKLGYEGYLNEFNERKGYYGKFRGVIARLEEVRPLLRLRKLTVSWWLEKNYPDLWMLTRQTGSRLGEMLDYLGGTLQVFGGTTHPAVREVLIGLTLKVLPNNSWRKRGFAARVWSASGIIAEELRASVWHTRLFSW